MTLEELQAKVAELTEAQEALQATNNGLKADLKKAKNELNTSKGVDVAEFTALQSENEALKAKVNDADKSIKKITGERDLAIKARDDDALITSNMQRDRDLTEALSAVGVTNAVYLKAAKSMLAAQVQVVIDGDKRVTKVGDKLLTDFSKEWAASDEGKTFITPADNSGGGSMGGAAGTQSNQNLTSTQKIAAGLKQNT